MLWFENVYSLNLVQKRHQDWKKKKRFAIKLAYFFLALCSLTTLSTNIGIFYFMSTFSITLHPLVSFILLTSINIILISKSIHKRFHFILSHNKTVQNSNSKFLHCRGIFHTQSNIHEGAKSCCFHKNVPSKMCNWVRFLHYSSEQNSDYKMHKHFINLHQQCYLYLQPCISSICILHNLFIINLTSSFTTSQIYQVNFANFLQLCGCTVKQLTLKCKCTFSN